MSKEKKRLKVKLLSGEKKETSITKKDIMKHMGFKENELKQWRKAGFTMKEAALFKRHQIPVNIASNHRTLQLADISSELETSMNMFYTYALQILPTNKKIIMNDMHELFAIFINENNTYWNENYTKMLVSTQNDQITEYITARKECVLDTVNKNIRDIASLFRLDDVSGSMIK